MGIPFLLASGRWRGHRSFIFSESDWPYPFLPGLYCSLAKQVPWARSWSFLLGDDSSDEVPRAPRYLYSFVGRVSTHANRRKIIALDRADGPCVDVGRATSRFGEWHYHDSYRRLLSDSAFVLCPRGIGAASIRIFEAMRVGRVPVIVADAWQPPPGPDWARFSVRVAERDIGSIPTLLQSIASQADAMGRAAREMFQQYFGPAKFLDQVIDQCLSLESLAGPAGWPETLSRGGRLISWREIRSLVHDGFACFANK